MFPLTSSQKLTCMLSATAYYPFTRISQVLVIITATTQATKFDVAKQIIVNL